MPTIVFENASVLDTVAGTVLPDRHVLVRQGRIAAVSDAPIGAAEAGSDARRIDLGGKILMPGLCDGHVHVTAITANFPLLQRLSPFYVALRSSNVMEEMLLRGFTTVRDAGGGDHGLAQAVAEDRVPGPRMLYCGKALSQTGGHADMRSPGECQHVDECFCCSGLGRVCDGVPEVRRAVRDEVRKGATHIKIMASGGVSSPTDRIDSTQFAGEEIDAIIEECEAANIYAMAHAYTARAIDRLIVRGVRTIEHGNLMDEGTAKLFLEHGAYLVPTLATYHALASEGVKGGLSPDLLGKLHEVLDAGTRALELAHRAGVTMVYGTDLLGDMHRHQLNEFHLRKEVVEPAELIRQCTVNAAKAFMAEGDFGVVAEGARADLLVVDGNPLDDINLLTRPETALLAIFKGGKVYKDLLG
ncbi:MAG: amidohydrolase family protein [Rhodospirillaceae bacterium]|nr:amidohydrolase family protein [Rhodospirillaceae bacterium]